MVQGGTTSDHRRRGGKKAHHERIPRPTNGQTPRDSANKRPHRTVLLVAEITERRGRLHQGMRPVSSQQNQYTHIQGPPISNNDIVRNTPVPDSSYGFHHETTPV